jgi:hypothetical protein
MYVYHLRPYHKIKARQLGVIIKPSVKNPYKIDVFSRDTGEYVTSIGDRRFDDWLSIVEEKGFDEGERRRQLYLKRHAKDSKVEGSRGFFSASILWGM